MRLAISHHIERLLIQMAKYDVGLAAEHRYYEGPEETTDAQLIITRCNSLQDAYIFSDGSVEPPLFSV